ncbi:hypothetical protein MIR68_000171 [Amoeboaphelidium protococcarum]|nr:hypothetical protein MIR68_000171 [Amoeboaphelidium protococcarum]
MQVNVDLIFSKLNGHDVEEDYCEVLEDEDQVKVADVLDIKLNQAGYHVIKKRILTTTEEFTSKQHPVKNVLHPQLGSERFCVLDDFSDLRDNVGAYNVMSRSFTKGEVIIESGGGILHVQQLNSIQVACTIPQSRLK